MMEKTKPFGERRLFERKPCSRMISIDNFKDSYSGQIRDLGVGGAFIEPSYKEDSRIGQELELVIPFALKQDHLKIRAKVAWSCSNGIGVRFITPKAHSRRYFR